MKCPICKEDHREHVHCLVPENARLRAKVAELERQYAEAEVQWHDEWFRGSDYHLIEAYLDGEPVTTEFGAPLCRRLIEREDALRAEVRELEEIQSDVISALDPIQHEGPRLCALRVRGERDEARARVEELEAEVAARFDSEAEFRKQERLAGAEAALKIAADEMWWKDEENAAFVQRILREVEGK